MGHLIEGDYPQFEQFWPEYSKNISLGSLLDGIIHEKDDAGGIIKTSLNMDWRYKAPKLSNQQIEDLEQKLVVPAGAENVEKVANILKGYTALEMLAAGEDEELGKSDVAGMMRAKTVAGYILDFASAALDKDKEWCKTIPPFLEKAEELIKKVGGRSKGILEVAVLNLAGSYMWKYGKYKESEEFHLKALKIAKDDCDDQILVAKTYNHLAALFGDWKERPETAEEYTEAAIKILKSPTLSEEQKKDADKILASIYNNQGVRFHKQAEEARLGDNLEGYKTFLENSINSYKESINHAKKVHLNTMCGWASFNLAEALAYLAVVKHSETLLEQAKTFAGFAKKIFTELNPSLRGNTGYSMAEGVIATCEGDIYKAKGDDDKARESWTTAVDWLDKSINLRRQLEEDRRTADCLASRAEVYERVGERDKCKADLNEALELYEKISSGFNIAKVKKMLES